ncbi:low temperature requirement protein A [Actinoplanes sp. NPDC020271]|uniref:low temperature requirement protein A n=1 Tax=Actinoplanes sp. NPDC020271 TaxID=3363896 RepID=UPI00379AC077
MSPMAVEERHATWLELFFDLVIVAAVAQLAHLLHSEPDGRQLLIFAVLYYAMWSVWTGFTLYANVAATRTRLLTMLAAMFGIAVMAASVPQLAEHDRPQPFIVAYLACRMLAIASWKRENEVMTEWPGVHQALGLIPWVASLGFDAPARYWLWALGIVFDIGFSLLASRSPERLLAAERRDYERDQRRWTTRLVRRYAPWHEADPEPQAAAADRPHLVERLGLFVIIVLGEAVAQLVNAAAGVDEWSYRMWLLGLIGFGLLVALWWLTLNAAPASEALRALRLTMPVHYLTTAAIVAIAAGLGGLAGESGHASAAVRWVLCGGAAVYFLVAGPIGGSGTALRWTLGWALPSAAGAILLGAFGAHLAAWLLVGGLLVLTLWQVGHRRLASIPTVPA